MSKPAKWTMAMFLGFIAATTLLGLCLGIGWLWTEFALWMGKGG